MNLLLSFDGACEPNPGGLATYGWILEEVRADGPVKLTEGRGLAKLGQGATNNLAEWYGLGHGLRSILDAGLRVESLEIRGDSQLVVNQLSGAWQCKAEHLRSLKDRCLDILQEIGCQWRAVWVRRDRNSTADGLSVQAWEEQTGKPFPKRRG